MRIPALHTLWVYRNRTCFLAEKKVDPSGEGWAKLTSVPPHKVSYWVPFHTLFEIGIPLRDEMGIQRHYHEQETK